MRWTDAGDRRAQAGELPVTRSLPEIVRTHGRDIERHAELLMMARGGTASGEQLDELTVIDADLHRFGRMCRRWAPLSLTELGYRWGSTLTHEDSPAAIAIVRENGLVEHDGRCMTLMEATTHLAAAGTRSSLAGWTGEHGAVGDLAGLRPRNQTEAILPEMVDEAGMERMDGNSDAPIKKAVVSLKTDDETKDQKPTPSIGGNYDLFG